MQLPSFLEDHISQIPALQVLQNLGYKYLRPSEVYLERGGRLSNVLLENILEEQLRKLNKVRFKGDEQDFSDANIKAAIQKLKDIPDSEGLVRKSELIYDLISLGESFEQRITENDVDEDDENSYRRSFSLRYIDWENFDKNVFHIAEEFEVERTGSKDKRRPDIVLFVNGIPFVIIECKRPDDKKNSINSAISQHLRNQRRDEIPHLYAFSQIVLAINKNEALYGTTNTALKFWSKWREEDAQKAEEEIEKIVNKPLSLNDNKNLFLERFAYVKDYFQELEINGRKVTEQDRVLYSLCRPERLLELAHKFIVYDAGEKKIARYQQYFAVENTAERIHQFETGGNRKGGVIWHTQGSGKSLTMVMLAKTIVLDKSIKNPRIILVTDRTDLDDQIYKTFRNCGKSVKKATSGEDLYRLLSEEKEAIITTIINKFENVVGKRGYKNDSSEIFVLVDEGHRTNYGELHQKMRKTLKNACYISFTGTPLLKKDKNTVNQFGGFIDPTYTIRRAVEDKAVVPLLYEGRLVLQDVNREALDKWFEIHTKSLNDKEKADLKRKFSSADQLNKADRKIYMTAYDISEHFRQNWQGTFAKAQLAAPSKAAALKYKKYLDEFGIVSSEVLISPPDDREGNENVEDGPTDEEQIFWKKMMDRFSNEKKYNEQLINQFKNASHPEIIIVVSKLLTGFDAPRNTVLYLTKKLREHELLQAIARVNRLYEGKEFGYVVDYYGILGELDDAMQTYGSLAGFDAQDIQDALINIKVEIETLPQKFSELLNIFKEIKNERDEEEYEQFLADEEIRQKFYDKFSAYNRALGVALSSFEFHEKTSEEKIAEYKKYLRFFQKLRVSVKRRYAETIDYKEYEAKVQKLIDTHIQSDEVLQIVEPVNIFDQESFAEEVEKLESDAARADTIAHRTKKTITEKMEEDPYFYRRFSKILAEAIKEFQDGVITSAEYLQRVSEVMNSVINRDVDSFPAELKHNDNAKAYFGVVSEIIGRTGNVEDKLKPIATNAALEIDKIIEAGKVVDWTDNDDIKNSMRNSIDDYLYSIREHNGFDLDYDLMDRIIEETIDIAKKRDI